MKRIFVPVKKTIGRQKIERDALERFREVKGKFGSEYPELLDTIKNLYEKSLKAAPLQPPPVIEPPPAEIAIDRVKNMETVARFLQITNSETIKKALRDGKFLK